MFNTTSAVCLLLYYTWPLELVCLYALVNYRDGNSSTCFPFLWCFQIGKHDEAWMILKQVHDTNMRAKGEPERVFTVSLTKPPACKKKILKNSTFLLCCSAAPVYSSFKTLWAWPLPAVRKRTLRYVFLHLKLDTSLFFQELVNPVNCSEYSPFLVLLCSL